MNVPKRQKIFWVLVFSFMYLVLVDAMDRSIDPKKLLKGNVLIEFQIQSKIQWHKNCSFSNLRPSLDSTIAD